MEKGDFGFSLVEAVVTLAVAGVLVLGVAELEQWGASRYYLSVEENTAQQNILLAAYYLKFFLSQAVETTCAGGALSNPTVTLATPAAGTVFPPQIGIGQVDCRLGGPPIPVVWNPGINAFAIFNREIGGNANLALGTFPVSNFSGTGIYFQPPTGNQSGILYFGQAAVGSQIIDLSNSIQVDHIVDFQVVSATSSPSGSLESMVIQITARYIKEVSATPSYLPNAPYVPNYRDLTMTVNVGLRDNWLGNSLTGSGSSERLYGGLYFFLTRVPVVTAL